MQTDSFVIAVVCLTSDEKTDPGEDSTYLWCSAIFEVPVGYLRVVQQSSVATHYPVILRKAAALITLLLKDIYLMQYPRRPVRIKMYECLLIFIATKAITLELLSYLRSVSFTTGFQWFSCRRACLFR